ncbi:MAG: DNA primase [Deltaproteobacteria bacterium]|nr:DNA primase [Candidatus Anaeroferrophillacea bacterium]
MTAYHFPSEFVAELRDCADIVEVVGDYVALVKSGANHKGCCPFHREKTPSFMVHREKRIFHCFGCGVGGDVITFLMKVEQLSYPEAVERLARRCGMDLSPYERGGGAVDSGDRHVSRRQELSAVVARANQFYCRQLERELDGRVGEYLDRRGISHEVARKFGLGYAPPGWDTLRRAIKSARDLDNAVAAGLLVQKDSGRLYDRFRDRLLFPIRDAAGTVVGFGGRIIGDGEPKYLNSSDSPLFQKRRLLYDLAHAKHAIAREQLAIVVEGYMDALTLYAHGIDNVVATLGTALTGDHLRVLGRYGRQAAVFFDNDEAGLRAAFRSLPTFLEAGVMPEVISLPEGVKDPDQLVRERGIEALSSCLRQRISLLDRYVAVREAENRGASVGRRRELLREVVDVVARIPDQVLAGLALRGVAERFGVSEEMVTGLFRRARRRPRSAAGRQPEVPTTEAGNDWTSLTELDPEEYYVMLVLRHPGMPVVDEELRSLLGQKLPRRLLELYAEVDGDREALLPRLAAEDHDHGAELQALYTRLELFPAPESGAAIDRELADCRLLLERRHLRREVEEINRRIRSCADEDDLTGLLRRKMEMVQRHRR